VGVRVRIVVDVTDWLLIPLIMWEHGPLHIEWGCVRFTIEWEYEEKVGTCHGGDGVCEMQGTNVPTGECKTDG